jgi:protein-tyrosine phosphatase
MRVSDTMIAAFLAVALHPRYQPIYVHCIGGDDRTGALVGIYRIAVDGWPFDWVYDEMLDNRFHPWQLFLLRDVKNFSRRMTPLNVQQRMSALQKLVQEKLFTVEP